MTLLLTGTAGFIGYHVAEALLARGEPVLGADSLNDYYDPALKRARLDRLRARDGFSFHRLDVSDRAAVAGLLEAAPGIDRIVHLAAQAGVRHSFADPYAYVQANVMGQVVLLEAAHRLAGLKHMVYASSSSVYGANDRSPFSVAERVDSPVSVYAATKRAGELLSDCYARNFGLPLTGLRFFTVYGPWGRPDMAYYAFTKAILEGRPIRVYNQGDMRRDFTYVDDAVAGVLAALDRPPPLGGAGPPHRIYNLGNNRAEDLMEFIAVLERACGRAAVKDFTDMQPGDVKETYADIAESQRDLGFAPRTTIAEGLPRFVAWFRDYHGV